MPDPARAVLVCGERVYGPTTYTEARRLYDALRKEDRRRSHIRFIEPASVLYDLLAPEPEPVDDRADFRAVIEATPTSELYGWYRDARDRHGWSDNSLAYDFGEILVSALNLTETYDDDGEYTTDYEAIGDAAISHMEEIHHMEIAR